jgi:hypothetical protein
MIKSHAFLSLLSFVLSMSSCLDQSGTTDESRPTAQTVSNLGSTEELVLQGEYLVTIMLCDDCHTPKVMTETGPKLDLNRRLSGHPSASSLAKIGDPSILQNYALFNMDFTSATGPWGTSFSGNLTPDESGLGNWTFENFERVLRLVGPCCPRCHGKTSNS